jgi:hypothetical protein
MKDHQMYDSARLNTSVIGIGKFGCSILESIVKMGVDSVFTLALSTNADCDSFKHPAARSLYVNADNCDDRLSLMINWLSNSDFNIIIFSSDCDYDYDLAKRLADELLIADQYCKSLAITDVDIALSDNALARLNNSFTSAVSAPTAIDFDNIELINKYVTTLVDVIYHHAVIGIEYTDLIDMFDSDLHYITQQLSIKTDKNNLINQLVSLHEQASVGSNCIIVCFKGNVQNKETMLEAINSIRGNEETKYIFSIIPDEMAHETIEVTMFCFNTSG